MIQTYKIIVSRSAEKEMTKLPEIELKRVLQCIEGLIIQPLPHGYKKLKNFGLKGFKNSLYRVRTGNYRIIYSIDNDIVTISILRVGYRKISMSNI